MLNGQEIYRSVEVTDDVQTSSLSILDQLRLIVSKLSNDDAAELDRNEKLTTARLQKVASLTDFIEKAVSKMREKELDSVTVKLASVYKPYFAEVFDEKKGFGRYYKFEVYDKRISMSISHFVVVRISKKGV